MSSLLRYVGWALDAVQEFAGGRVSNSRELSLDGVRDGGNLRPNPAHFVTAERQANAVRRGLIMKAHPEVEALVARDPLTGVAVLAIVGVQVAVAAALARYDASWTAVVLLGACVLGEGRGGVGGEGGGGGGGGREHARARARWSMAPAAALYPLPVPFHTLAASSAPSRTSRSGR